MTQSPSEQPRRPRPGNDVHTPNGRVARVLSIDEKRMEAIVAWENGDRGTFRLSQLRFVGDEK